MNKSRAILIASFMSVAFVLLIGKLYSIQITNHDKFTTIAMNQQFGSKDVAAERGSIFDRNNELLVFSKNNISFYVDNKMSKAQVSDTVIAEKFSKVFGKPINHYLDLINSGTGQVCIESKVNSKYAIELDKFIVDRLYHVEDNSRVYPYGSLASHVMGFVNNSNTGVSGIEKVLNDNLKGFDGNLVIEKDVSGRTVSVDENTSTHAIGGEEVILTIDKNYQQILETELFKGINKFKGKAASGIIVNPMSGEVLALANYPNFDPQKYNLFDNNSRRNRAITDTYEPGSTIKSIFFAILKEENKLNLNEVINVENGKYNFHSKFVRDTHPYDKLTVREVLEQSSNIGVVKLSSRIEEQTFYKYYRDFGFGNITGIELPGEVRGTLKKPKQFTKFSKPFMAHGYELAVTPLQITMAYASLINGGKLMRPNIIKSFIDDDGQVTQNNPTQIRRVISENTSLVLRDLMVGVVENGTGSKAQLQDILVGGKTGTSQKLINGRYSNQNYNSSFIGFFPADAPKVLVCIWVDSPQIGKYGGQVAAPIFKGIAQKIIENDLSFSKYKIKIDRTSNYREDLIAKITSDENSNSLVSANLPTPETRSDPKTANYRTIMPNLKGKSLRKAISLVSSSGLKFKIEGSGIVKWQSIQPGKKIKAGQTIKLRCSN